jgi:endonuclease-3
VSFGKTTGVAVDTHVHRISNRLGFVKYTKDPIKTMDGLMKKFDKKYWEEININLVGFGQLMCGKVKPKCGQCPVRSDCALGSKLKDIEDLAKAEQEINSSKLSKIIKLS